MRSNPHRERVAFTLVELIVAIAIILFLAALLIAFMPAVWSRTEESNGAQNLQGWLNTARQKAIRNQNPYGLRLWVRDMTVLTPGATINGPLTAPTLFVSECQYIEQPDDFTGGALTTASDNQTNVTISGVGIDLTGGFGIASDPQLFPVQPGDYLEVLGTGLMHRVVQVTSPTSLTVATPIPYQVTTTVPTIPGQTTNYRILRQARVIGTETLAMPGGVFVDLNVNVNSNINPTLAAQVVNPLPFVPVYAVGVPAPPPLVGYYVDVLFGPSGSVITQGVTGATMNFWVRQPDQSQQGLNAGNIYAGNPTIIAVFAQTGLVGAYPPVPGSNPYVDIH